ncbi:MAG: DUF1543 domain-containing protein [Mucilaginibacter sp.]
MQQKLFMLLLGCKPPGRHTEQHDILFAIGNSPKDLIEQINSFWPEAEGRIHVDAWREVTAVDGYKIEVVEKSKVVNSAADAKLFFINLGGYIKDVFDEQHYILLSVNPNSGSAIKNAKQTLFYQQNGFKGASSHVDDKYGIDVDDLYEVQDILLPAQKEKYTIQITPESNLPNDEINLGYFKLSALP